MSTALALEKLYHSVKEYLEDKCVDTTLVLFNPTKTQFCVLTAKILPRVVCPRFENTPLPAAANIAILGVDISSEFKFRGHFDGKAK